MVLVWLQYRRRNRRLEYNEYGDSVNYGIFSDARRLENFNTKIYYMWWVLGLAATGCSLLMRFFCIVLHVYSGLAVCFCLPCIIALLCIFAGRQVHQRLTSVSFPNTDLKFQVTRSNQILEQVEWFILKQMVRTSLLNVFF